MITVILKTGSVYEHENADGLELTTYRGPESPEIRLLQAGVGLPGKEVRYKLDNVERLMVSPNCEVGPVGEYVQVDVVTAGRQAPEAKQP